MKQTDVDEIRTILQQLRWRELADKVCDLYRPLIAQQLRRRELARGKDKDAEVLLGVTKVDTIVAEYDIKVLIRRHVPLSEIKF